MRCPFCGALETRVTDSRLSGEQDQIRRRRECNECKERFTTYETAELNLPRVIKHDGKRERFDESKLRGGVLRSLEKRPVPVDAIDCSLSRVKHKALVAGEKELPARLLGEWVMEELRELDQVAYIRFASVYRSFEDVDQFREVIDNLRQHQAQNAPTSES